MLLSSGVDRRRGKMIKSLLLLLVGGLGFVVSALLFLVFQRAHNAIFKDKGDK